jgi:hypothetical protein
MKEYWSAWRASDPVEEHGPILFKGAIFYILLQVKANAVVALLAYPITEENGTRRNERRPGTQKRARTAKLLPPDSFRIRRAILRPPRKD